jgi:hypothetical protein
MLETDWAATVGETARPVGVHRLYKRTSGATQARFELAFDRVHPEKAALDWLDSRGAIIALIMAEPPVPNALGTRE